MVEEKNMMAGRGNRGFTMMEMLVVIVIIVIMGGLAFLSFFSSQRNLYQIEMDGTAKELYVAAQNHLTAAKAQGTLDSAFKSGSGANKGGIIDADLGVYYYVVEGTSGNVSALDSLLNNKSNPIAQMLPFGSIDDTVRRNGSYIIRYQVNEATARVLDVFYADPHGQFPVMFPAGTYAADTNGSYYNTLTSGYEGSENRDARRNYGDTNGVIGWWGGDQAVAFSTTSGALNNPVVEVTNAERLRVRITDTNMTDYTKAPLQANLRLEVRGVTSGAVASISLVNKGSFIDTTAVAGYYNVAVGQCIIDLDDVTDSGFHVLGTSGGSGHFADIPVTLLETPSKTFIPGEDLEIQAIAYSNTVFAADATSTTAVTNSLFDSVVDTVDPTSKLVTKRTAVISSMRHLENMDPTISRFDIDALKTAGGSTIGITSFEQINDLSWMNFKRAISGQIRSELSLTTAGGTVDDSLETAAVDDEKTALVQVSKLGHTSLTQGGMFMPVVFNANYAMEYEGNAFRVFGVTVNGAGDAGLFGTLTQTGSAIRNLELVNFDIETTDGNAGALAGSAAGLTISSVLAHNDSDEGTTDAGLEITGASNVGGLVGSLNGGAIGESAAALYVRSGGAAGGLIGQAVGDVRIVRSYSGGHTFEKAYLTRTDQNLVGRINVIGDTAAGGLVGDASGVSGSFAVTNSYSTCSARAVTVGGLVGTMGNGSLNSSYAAGLVERSSGATGAAGGLVGQANNAVSFGDEDSANYYFPGMSSNVTGIGGVATDPDGVSGVTYAQALEPEVGIAHEGNSRADAQPYDTNLDNNFDYSSISQLYTDLPATAPFFLRTHVGDWAIPDDVELKPITIEDFNEENHYIVVHDPNYEDYDAANNGKSVVTLTYTGQTSGKSYTRVLLQEGKTVGKENKRSMTSSNSSFQDLGFETDQYCRSFQNGTERVYYVLIDSITSWGYDKMLQDGHFADRFPGFIAGENITIQASVTCTSRAGHKTTRDKADNATLTTNSLFANIKLADGGKRYAAHIKNARHLENLEYDISHLGRKSWDSNMSPVDYDFVLTEVVVDNDILWEEGDGFSSSDSLTAFWVGLASCPTAPTGYTRIDNGYTAFDRWQSQNSDGRAKEMVSRWSPGGETRSGKYRPIRTLSQDANHTIVASDFTFNGEGNRIINLSSDKSINEAKSLFNIVHRGRDVTFKDTFLVNPRMEAANDKAGAAFVGEAGTGGSGVLNLTFDSCGTYMINAEVYRAGSYNLSKENRGKNDVDGRRISSDKGSAGGFVARSNCHLTILDSFAAVPVTAGDDARNGNSTAAGGLVAWIIKNEESTATIKRSYVGGFLPNVSDNRTKSYSYDYECVGVTAFSSHPNSGAGGFIGWFAPSSAEIKDCYTTASVASNCYSGGFLGRADLKVNQTISNCYAVGTVYYPNGSDPTITSTSYGGGRFLATTSTLPAYLLKSVFSKCRVLSDVNTVFCLCPSDYVHPERTLGPSNDEGYIEDLTTSQLEALGTADVNRRGKIYTRAYSIRHLDYPYPAVNATAKGLESATGETTRSAKTKRAHYGDWPKLVMDITIEDVNKENHYVVITDNDYQATSTDPGAEGLIVLEYKTRATDGSELVYKRELHPEYGVNYNSNGSGKIVNESSSIGFESSQFCKYYDEAYTDEDGNDKIRRRYYVLIDSITTLHEQNQNGHAIDRFRGIAPGADITVTAYVKTNGALVEQGSVITNSLFESIEAKSSSSNIYTAHLTNARHLQNLSPLISGLDNNNNTVKIGGFSLDDDVMWEDVYDYDEKHIRSENPEAFYRSDGSRIYPFWDMIHDCIPGDALDNAGNDEGNVKYSFSNWMQPVVYRYNTNQNTQAAFTPIKLLDRDAKTTGVTTFEAAGNNRRIINLTMGGINAKNGAWNNNYGAIGLFETPGAYKQQKVVQDTLKLHIHDLYMVNPGSEYNDKTDTSAAPFVGEACCYLVMERCGAYMSSVQQYWMGSADLESDDNIRTHGYKDFDQTMGMHDPHGRRMFSKGGAAGGLVGRLFGSLSMSDCFAAVPLFGGINGQTNSAAAGGLIGWVRNHSDRTYEYSSELQGKRKVTVEDSYAGGFLASSKEKITEDSETYTYSADSVGIATFSTNSGSGSGGFVGRLSWGGDLTIRNCYSTAAVGGNIYAAGAIGRIESVAVGGTHIDDCYTLGVVFNLKSTSKQSGMFCNVDGDVNKLKQIFTNCYTYGIVNSDFTEETAYYTHPATSAGGIRGKNSDDSEIIPFHYESLYEGDTAINIEFLEKDRVDHNGAANRTMTSSYNIAKKDYPYRAVTDAGLYVVPQTGRTVPSRAEYVHVGDWPAVVYSVEIENVNAEQNYVIVTNENYRGGNKPTFGSDGLIVLEYKTIDTSGNELVYQRELHPELKASDKRNGKYANASGKITGESSQIGFETGQFCKCYDEKYTDEKGVQKTRRRYYVLLDSITATFASDQSGHATAAAYGRFPEMAPGADITVTAYVRLAGGMVKVDSVNTNSLFDRIEKPEGSDQYVAHVANGRHLQNLTQRMALLDNKNDALKISKVSIDKDIMWEDAVGSSEQFYDSEGNLINSFWSQVSACIPAEVSGAANWANNVLSISNANGKNSSIKQSAFAPIQLLDQPLGPEEEGTGVYEFEVIGNNHRLINFTLGGQVAGNKQIGQNWGAIGLFETPGAYGGSTDPQQSVHLDLKLSMHDLFMVNPNVSILNINKADMGSGAFVGEPSCTLIMNNCGAYMSSLEQYWMGSADMDDDYNRPDGETSTFDPTKGMHDPNGRRILSNAGGAGGLIGRLHGSATITNCFAAVPVYGGSRGNNDNASAGGLIGEIRAKDPAERKIVISNCYTGGYLSNSASQVGGDESTSTYTYSAQSVGVAEFSTNNASGAGGFIGKINWGKDIVITDCYSTAAVAGNINVGGFFGYCEKLTENGVRVNTSYSLGAVYMPKNGTRRGGMFCAAPSDINIDTLRQSFTGCYTFGAANSDFSEVTEYYDHPTTSTGGTQGDKYHDGSEYIPFHFTSQGEGDTVVDIKYLEDDRKEDARTATMGYSVLRADYPYRAVTDAGKDVIEVTGRTSVANAGTTHVGDWPYIQTVSDAKVSIVDDGSKLTANISVRKNQFLSDSVLTLLIRGNTSKKGALVRFKITADTRHSTGYSFAIDESTTSDDENIRPIVSSEWLQNLQASWEVDGDDRIKLSLVLDDPSSSENRRFTDLFNASDEDTGLIPGESIALAADMGAQSAIEMEGIMANPVFERAGIVAKTNSLFADIVAANEAGTYKAQIANLRHLKNLDLASGVNKDGAGLKIESAEQIDDIAADGSFQGIEVSGLVAYNGADKTISGLAISDESTTGFFTSINSDLSVSNVTLVGTVTASKGAGQDEYAGAVVGLLGDCTLTLDSVNITDVEVIAPNTNLGGASGYVGEMDYSDKGTVVIDGKIVVKDGKVVAVESAALKSAIDEAQALFTTHEHDTSIAQDDINALKDAIDAAQAVFDRIGDPNLSQDEVDSATETLKSAISAFKGKVSLVTSAIDENENKESNSSDAAADGSESKEGDESSDAGDNSEGDGEGESTDPDQEGNGEGGNGEGDGEGEGEAADTGNGEDGTGEGDGVDTGEGGADAGDNGNDGGNEGNDASTTQETESPSPQAASTAGAQSVDEPEQGE